MPSSSTSHHVQKRLMHAGIVGKLGMESCGHNTSLPHGDRILTFGGDHFHPCADALDFRGANENHFERRISQPALTDRAVNLPPISITAYADIDRPKSSLLGIF